MLLQKDSQIQLLKQENATLRAEKRIFEKKYKDLVKENKQKEVKPQPKPEQNDHQEMLNAQLMQMFMQANMVREIGEDVRKRQEEEHEMLEAAIQSSLQDNPNPDVMNYE